MQKSGYLKRDHDPNVRLSKNLSYLLKHGAHKEGLKIDKEGWICVNDILQLLFYRFRKITAEKIKNLAENAEIKRYQVKTETDKDGNPVLYIRATKGHTLKLDEEEDDNILDKIEEASEVPFCVHGTFEQSWQSIKKEGLKAISSDQIHFANGYPGETGLISGMREPCTIFIELDVEKALKDGMELFLTKNNTIVTKGFDAIIPTQYFKKVVSNNEGKYQEIHSTEYNTSMNTENNSLGGNTMTGQAFKYLLVLDFEAQCDGDKKLDVQEIIEFPVVIVDVENRKILDDKFHYYIKPEVHPQLYPSCIELTGITQDKVDNGILLKDALDKLEVFLREKGILDTSYCFVTCGHWDLNTCLRKEALAKNIPVKGFLKYWVNLKTSYPPIPGVRVKNPELIEMLKLSNLELIGRHHSGIDDATNLARVALHLLQNGFKFKTTMMAHVDY